MNITRVLRWTAVALAAAAIFDPHVPLPRRERPSVRLVTGAEAPDRERLSAGLRGAGFSVAADGEAATIVTAGVRLTPPLPSTPIYVVREDAGVPDVSIVRASAADARVATQAIAVAIAIHASGGRGVETTVHLEDGGLAVASASHRWTADEETWQTRLSYLPSGRGALRLRVRAGVLPGERRTADNVADLLAPPARGPVRVLAIEPSVAWPAAFVRRALEAAPAFAVSAVQHATKAVATRAGSPPRAISRRDLAPFEAVLIGQPDALESAALDAVRWFVEERGGVAILVPDRIPPAGYPGFAGGAVDMRTLDTPATLSGIGAGLVAGELAIPRALPPLAFTLASDPAGAPIVFGLRRGLGAVIVSGALDAWRYRDRNDAGFARFWRAAILQQALVVPPTVEVTASPSLARPGEVVRLTARLRRTEIPENADRFVLPPATARVVNPAAPSESVVRLWPSAEPGVYEGEWRPAAVGDTAVDVSIGASNGSAMVTVAADAVGAVADETTGSIAARGSGGAVVAGEPALVRALADRFPFRTVMRPVRVARSPWYVAAFALLLCSEWAIRRRQGLS